MRLRTTLSYILRKIISDSFSVSIEQQLIIFVVILLIFLFQYPSSKKSNNSEVVIERVEGLPAKLKYDINKVSPALLSLIPFVSDKDVFSIVEFRKNQGKISSFDELEKIGIKKRTLHFLKKYLKIENENSYKDINDDFIYHSYSKYNSGLPRRVIHYD